MVPQCTTRDAATAAHDNASRATIPISAGRTAPVSQTGSVSFANSRGPTFEPTPIRAPNPCTTSTPVKARRAFGVCNSVITEAASCTTASAIAAISSGPPSADPMIHRMTNQDPRAGVICAVPRAVAHTINAAGARGSTPSCWPAMETGTRCVASQMLATAPNVPVRSLLAMTSCTSVTAAMMATATRDGPNATRTRSRGCGAPTAVGGLFSICVTRRAVSGEWRGAPGQDDDVEPDGGSAGSGGWLAPAEGGGE